MQCSNVTSVGLSKLQFTAAAIYEYVRHRAVRPRWLRVLLEATLLKGGIVIRRSMYSETCLVLSALVRPILKSNTVSYLSRAGWMQLALSFPRNKRARLFTVCKQGAFPLANCALHDLCPRYSHAFLNCHDNKP